MHERHRRCSAHRGPGGNVANDSGLGADAGAFADPQVTAQPTLAPDHDMIPEAGAARDSHLGDNDASASETDVVPDLHQIINPAAVADHGIGSGTAVDGGIGADLHVVADDHPAELGNREMSVLRGDKAETILTDAHAGGQPHPHADDAAPQRRRGTDSAIVTDHDARADDRIGADLAPLPDLRPRPDHHPRGDRGIGADDGGGIDCRARSDTSGDRCIGIKRPRDEGVCAIGVRGDQQCHGCGRIVVPVRMHEAGPGPAVPERIAVAGVVEKADLFGAGNIERCDIADHARRVGIAYKPYSADFRKLGKAERAIDRIEAWIRHFLLLFGRFGRFGCWRHDHLDRR